MKIELQGRGPGRGLLRISGGFDEPESVAIAIQRNDGRYLGGAQEWQTTPHWHPQFRVQPHGQGLLLDVGPDIIDGVITVGGLPLKVVVRVDGAEDFGILRIQGELIGSCAAAPAGLTDQRDDSAVTARTATDADAPGAEVDSNSGADESTAIEPPRRSYGRVWLVLVLLLTVFAAAGVGWYLGLADDWLGAGQTAPGLDSVSQMTVEIDSEPTPAAEQQTTPERPREPELSGIALARSILNGRPAPDIIYARAEQAEQQKDCAAALILLNEAADADPRFAAALARRYDPLTFAAGGCIEQPDAPYAVVFFTDAARVGDVAAQRRLGQLMTERERSGATYEEGLEWLRKASESGDEQAGSILKSLGE